MLEWWLIEEEADEEEEEPKLRRGTKLNARAKADDAELGSMELR